MKTCRMGTLRLRGVKQWAQDLTSNIWQSELSNPGLICGVGSSLHTPKLAHSFLILQSKEGKEQTHLARAWAAWPHTTAKSSIFKLLKTLMTQHVLGITETVSRM